MSDPVVPQIRSAIPPDADRPAVGRRGFLAGSTAMVLLGGCARTVVQPDAPVGAIDIHNHIFNGRDVPVIGFLRQTILRAPHQDVDLTRRGDPLLALLKHIMLWNTPSAAEELATLDRAPALRDAAPVAVSASVLAQDQRALAQGLANLSADQLPAPAGLRRAAPDENRQLLDDIAADLGQGQQRRSALRTPQAEGEALAAEAFRTTGGDASLRTGSRPVTYVHDTPLIATLRWAAMLTRSRRDILAQLVSLYGGEGGIRVFSPSLVDFGRWFVVEESVSPLADQIEVLSALARSRQDVLILPFVPFCPLRAALEAEDTPGIDRLRHVRRAVTMGFAGVKLYPPMGFRPLGNNARLDWAPRAPRGGGAALDAELQALYLWCAENEVPIKAHANNSLAAGPNTGSFAAPGGWRRVLDQPALRDLSLNLAHFGGFEETGPDLPPGQTDWEDDLAAMLDDYPALYFDLSYWSEVLDAGSSRHARVVGAMGRLLRARPRMVERMMYGSDWSMLGREPGHQIYRARVVDALETGLALDAGQVQAVMGGNATRYLRLDRDGPQRRRLGSFFADNPVYQQLFPA